MEKSKATLNHDSWVATMRQIEGLRVEIEGLKKALDDSRNANGILEKELFTAQFGVARKTKVRKVVVRLPPIKSETLFPFTPEEGIVSFKSDTPTSTQILGSPSSKTRASSSPPPHQTPPSKPRKCATPLPSSNSYSVIDDQAEAEVELKVEVKEEPTLQTTLLSATVLPSLITTPSPSPQQLTISTISTLYEIADISSYPPQLPTQLTVTTGRYELSGLSTHAVPVGIYLEKLLINIFRAFTFLCLFSSLTFTQFTSVVVRSGAVVWLRAINREIAQVMKKYYPNQLGEGKGTLFEEKQAFEVAYPILPSVCPTQRTKNRRRRRLKSHIPFYCR